MDVFVKTILPLLSLVIGAVLAHVSTFLTNKAQLNREQVARDETRKISLTDRRENFELARLEELHDAFAELADTALTYKAAFESKAPILQESARKFGEADRKVRRLAGFVLDDDIRSLVEDAHDAALVSTRPAALGGDTSFNTLGQANLKINQAQFEIAKRIREIYKTNP